MEYKSDPKANTLIIVFSSLQISSDALILLFVACSIAQFFLLVFVYL